MYQVRAAFGVRVPVTNEQLREAAYSAAKKMNIRFGQFQSGLADTWCVVSARLDTHLQEESEAWLLIAVSYLQAGESFIFRLESEAVGGAAEGHGLMN